MYFSVVNKKKVFTNTRIMKFFRISELGVVSTNLVPGTTHFEGSLPYVQGAYLGLMNGIHVYIFCRWLNKGVCGQQGVLKQFIRIYM